MSFLKVSWMTLHFQTQYRGKFVNYDHKQICSATCFCLVMSGSCTNYSCKDTASALCCVSAASMDNKRWREISVVNFSQVPWRSGFKNSWRLSVHRLLFSARAVEEWRSFCACRFPLFLYWDTVACILAWGVAPHLLVSHLYIRMYATRWLECLMFGARFQQCSCPPALEWAKCAIQLLYPPFLSLLCYICF